MPTKFEQEMQQAKAQVAREDKVITYQVTGVLFVLMVIIAIGYNACSSEEPEPVGEINALIHSRDCVTNSLKAPATAVFAPLFKSTVTKTNDSTFTVVSYVDSQNSYGAMLRNAYTCTVVYSQGFKYVACKDVAIL